MRFQVILKQAIGFLFFTVLFFSSGVLVVYRSSRPMLARRFWRVTRKAWRMVVNLLCLPGSVPCCARLSQAGCVIRHSSGKYSRHCQRSDLYGRSSCRINGAENYFSELFLSLSLVFIVFPKNTNDKPAAPARSDQKTNHGDSRITKNLK